MQCTFHELHCLLVTIMCQTASCFLVAKFNIRCGDRQGRGGITLFTYRPNNKGPAIRCRIHQSDGMSLASNISIANMPHTRTNQILTQFIPFSAWGNSAHCHQRPGPWRLVRPGAEARRLINFCAKFVRKFSAETFHASLRFEFALVVVI
jgi:hypothetical protein